MVGITQFRAEEPGSCLGTEHPQALSIPRQPAEPCDVVEAVPWGGRHRPELLSQPRCAGLSCWACTCLWLEITAVLLPMGMGNGIWAVSGQLELYCAFKLASRRACLPWVMSLKEDFCKYFNAGRTLAGHWERMPVTVRLLLFRGFFINIWVGDSGSPDCLGDLDVFYQNPVLVDPC